MHRTTDAYLGLGANAPNAHRKPADTVALAIKSIGALGRVGAVSPFYESVAWPDPNQPPFVNAVVHLRTALSAPALLAGALAIEAAFGRVRSADPAQRYAPRPLDIDILDVDGALVETQDLSLPHPRMVDRSFVMRPLSDIAPLWRHPVSGEYARDIADRLADEGLKRLDLAVG